MGPARSIARHALGWLVAANAVGVLLAALLLWPDANSVVAPLTYGRWMPLHLDWQLYGWCALPLVGVLLTAVNRTASAPFCLPIRLWSAALFLGGISWLGGTVSGKLYLDWAGWARPLLPLAMGALWFAMISSLQASWLEIRIQRRLLLSLMMAMLAAVPILLYRASGTDSFPPINPDSGGATGTSLLGSNLAIVAIAGLLPYLLRLPREPISGLTRRIAGWFWPAFVLSILVYLLRPHGSASHHQAGEIIALGLVLLWVPLTVIYLSSFRWPAVTGRWLRASAYWWGALVVTGWVIFLPGFSESAKFTHVLVAHSHLALAGLVSSMNGALLAALGVAPGRDSAGFRWWQGACVAHILVLLTIGLIEQSDPSWLWSGSWTITALFAARLAAGIIQLAVSLHWLKMEYS